MTNSERITANNTRLSALVETAESLPDAGSGGGGVETCTVTLKSVGVGYLREIYTTQYVDGSLIQYNNIAPFSNTVTIENVVCGTVIWFITVQPIIPAYSTTQDSKQISGYQGNWAFTVATTAGVSCTIEVRDDD